MAHRVGFVSIAGRPSAGKSTLLNALVGEPIAITARQAQTTRTAMQGVLNTPDAQIIFIDMPGIHKSDTLFNRRMMETVRGALQDRDLILFVVDATHTPTEEDEQALSAVSKSSKAFLLLNKVDRVEEKPSLLPIMEYYAARFPFLHTLPVSARTGEGLHRLKDLIVEVLPEGDPLFPPDYLTDQPLRFMAAEIIREQILRVTREEVPHSTAILVDKWEEMKDLTRITATIHVERHGQKVIIIGKGGQTLKQIGTGARHRLERLLERNVFLSLFVKVKPNWREDPSFLNMIDWRAMIGSETEE